MLYLNAPYDSEVNLTGNRRPERLFLEHTHHSLVQHGVLVFVIPFEQLSDCAGILSANFTRLCAFRMADAESVRFRQIVVFGVRRNVRGAAHEESHRRIRMLAQHGGYERLPELEVEIVEPYAVPVCGEAALTYRGLPYNVIEDLLPHSAAWKQVSQVLLPNEDIAMAGPSPRFMAGMWACSAPRGC